MREGTEALDGMARDAHPPRPAWTVAALMTSDVVSLATAVMAAAALATTPGTGSGTAALLRCLPFTLLPLIAFAVAGLYPATGLGPVAEYGRIARALIFTSAASWFVTAFVLQLDALPIVLVVGALLALATVPLGRAVTRELGANRPWWGSPVVLLGDRDDVAAAIDRLRRTPRLGVRPVACVIEGTGDRPMHVHGVPTAVSIGEAMTPDDVRVRPDLLVLSDATTPTAASRSEARAQSGGAFIVPTDVASVAISGLSPTTVGRALAHRAERSEGRRPVQGFVKRALDVVFAVPFAVAAVPIIFVAALAVMFASPGPPFYYQLRIGLGGRPIRVWKLRTMYVDAAARLERHLASDPAAKLEWSRSFKLTRDPRILPGVGRFLRASSIDELPQVFNVLRGDMSFVGPRPFPEYHLQAFDDEFRTLRTTVRPGITGLWQVAARSDGDLATQRELDTAYIENWSLGLDLYLLARTPVAVLTARGAR